MWKDEYEKSAYEEMAERLIITALIQSIAIIANSIAIFFIIKSIKG